MKIEVGQTVSLKKGPHIWQGGDISSKRICAVKYFTSMFMHTVEQHYRVVEVDRSSFPSNLNVRIATIDKTFKLWIDIKDLEGDYEF